MKICTNTEKPAACVSVFVLLWTNNPASHPVPAAYPITLLWITFMDGQIFSDDQTFVGVCFVLSFYMEMTIIGVMVRLCGRQ